MFKIKKYRIISCNVIYINFKQLKRRLEFLECLSELSEMDIHLTEEQKIWYRNQRNLNLKMFNFQPLVVHSELVYEYQEGKGEVTVKCLNGEVQVSIRVYTIKYLLKFVIKLVFIKVSYFQVHECVLAFYSKPFRMFLKKGRI